MLKLVSQYSYSRKGLSPYTDERNRILSESNHSSWAEEGSCAQAQRVATASLVLWCAHHWPVKANSTRLARLVSKSQSCDASRHTPITQHCGSSPYPVVYELKPKSIGSCRVLALSRSWRTARSRGVLSASMVLSPTTSTCRYQPWKPHALDTQCLSHHRTPVIPHVVRHVSRTMPQVS